jgi:hypothetical protein
MRNAATSASRIEPPCGPTRQGARAHEHFPSRLLPLRSHDHEHPIFVQSQSADVRNGCVTVPAGISGEPRQIRTGVTAGGTSVNHNTLQVRTGVKAGALVPNHSALQVRTRR